LYALSMNTEQETPVIVVGALNLDVCGVPKDDFRPRDSNPGRVFVSAGGVGHNIARHLASAGVPVELLTVLGDDDIAWLLTRQCGREGVSLSHAMRLAGGSGTYCSVHDTDGDMLAAVNDMSLLDAFTPDCLAPRLPMLNAAPLIVMDANLPKDTLEYLAEHAAAPLLLDPVSGFKAERVRRVIGRFAAVKPNLLEAERLSGEGDPARAAAWFLRQGVSQVFISLGNRGVYYAGAASRGHLPAPAMRVKNCTGAGDAMISGIARAMLLGAPAEDAAAMGLAAVTKHLLAQGGSFL